MNNRFKLPAFILLTSLVSGCYLPGTEALLLSSASYFIKAQLLEDPGEVNQPMTVANLLAQARGEEITENSAKLPIIETPSLNPATKEMSVSELLNNARSENTSSPNVNTENQINEYPLILTYEDIDSEVFSELDKSVNSYFKPNSSFQAYVGSKTDSQDMSFFFDVFLKVRNLCSEQSNYCSADNLNIDPNLPVGKIMFVPEQGDSNA